MRRFFFGALFLFSFGLQTDAQPFAEEIRAFQRQDSLHFPEKGQVLFTGSSSFRLWHDVQAYFPGIPILNRGFGGACLTDLLFYEKQVISPYQPRQIVIYCGENDLASSDTVQARHILQRFKAVFEAIRQDYPRTPLVYVSMKPSPSRQHLLLKMEEGNRLIRQFLRKQKRCRYVDVFNKMVDKNGKPIASLFLADQLHMNREGYLIWQKALAPVIIKTAP